MLRAHRAFTWLLLLLLFMGTAGSFWNLHQREQQLSHEYPLQGTGLQILSLQEFREFYYETISNAEKAGAPVSRDNAGNPPAIALATMSTTELGKRLNAKRPGAHIRLFSDAPLAGSIYDSPKDAFERNALTALRMNPEKPFYRFEDFEGRPSLRYAVADRLQEESVQWSNTQPGSSKRDWKVGDVRGVLEFIRPLDNEVARGQAARRTDLIITLGMAGLGFAGLGVMYFRLQRTSTSLLHSESRTRAIVNAALDSIITIDHQGNVLEFNPAAEHTFGRRRQEVLGRQVSDLIIPPQDREAHHQGLRRYLMTGVGPALCKRLEVNALHADGSEFPVELNIDVIRHDGPPMFTAYVRDLTQKRQAEAALEERIRQAMLTAEIGVTLTRRDNVREMLQRCTEILVQRLDVAFARIWTLDEQDDMLELQASAGLYTHLYGPHSRVKLGQLKIGEIASQRKPHLTNSVIGDSRIGEQEWAKREGMVSFAGYPLVCQGRLVGVVAMFSKNAMSDATMNAIEAVSNGIAVGIEQGRVAAMLRESEEEFRTMFELASNSKAIIDPSRGRFLRVNQRFCKMLGFEHEELVKLDIFALTHPDDLPALRAGFDQLVESDVGMFTGEQRYLRKDGTFVWGQITAGLITSEAGDPSRCTVSIHDITHRKQIESALEQRDEQLRQSQKLEAVGALAGGVAHEFNNLLQAIRGYTEFAMNGLVQGDPRYQDLEQVLAASGRATSLTKQLLGFSRRQVIERIPLDPNEVVDGLVKMLRPLIGEQIELSVTLMSDEGRVHADPCLLQQMLLNLCINSRDAMPTGGKLNLRTERFDVTESYCVSHPTMKPGSYVVFCVADTGCGMPAEVRERIFEPFFTTKEVGKGTGLGLAMVYGVVQQHHGLLNVYSEPGIGTTFRIYLPFATSVERNEETSLPEAIAGGSEIILLAEDDAVVRALAERVLRQAGYDLLIASNGAEAIELFEANADCISLALLDAVMPKRTGREVHEHIKHRRPTVPVLFCSGYDPETGQVQHLKDDKVRLIQKPYDPQVLLTTVRELLDEYHMLTV